MLKTRTREVLYEQYRTEKLLAWRATRNVDQEETQRMLDGKLSSLIQVTFVLKLFVLASTSNMNLTFSSPCLCSTTIDVFHTSHCALSFCVVPRILPLLLDDDQHWPVAL